MTDSSNKMADSAVSTGPGTTEDSQPLGGINATTQSMYTGTTTAYTDAVTSRAPISNVFDRFVKLWTFELNDGDAIMTSVKLGDPFLAWKNNLLVGQKRANFELFKGAMQLEFVVTAPGMCYGAFVVTAVPKAGVATLPTGFVDFYPEQCMAYDEHQLIDLSTSSSVSMSLPFVWPEDYIRFSAYDANTPMYEIWYTRLSPLTSGTDETNVKATVTVYGKPIDYSISVPSFQAKRPTKKSDKVHNIGSLVADVTSDVPILSNIGSVVAKGIDGVADVMSWFGFTREPNLDPPAPMSIKPFTNSMALDATDSSVPQSLTMANSIDRDPSLVGGTIEDQAALADLYGRWIHVHDFDWNPSDVVDTTLASIPVSPFYNQLNDSGTLAEDHELSLTTAGYVGLPFRYWRGGMKYLVVIPVSARHRGKLQIHYSQYKNPTGTDITNVEYNEIIDTEAGQCYQFTVGYAQEKPMLECIPVTTDWVGFNSVPNNAINGYIRFRVVNPLAAPEINQGVRVHVFACATETMQFGVPRNAILVNGNVGDSQEYRDIIASVHYQAGAVGDGGCVDFEYTLVDDKPYDISSICCGEEFKSVRGMMQVPQKIVNYHDAAELVLPLNWVILPHFYFSRRFDPIPGGYTTKENYFSYFAHYGQMFVGIAGSTRYKVFASLMNTTTNAFGASDVGDFFAGPVSGFVGKSQVRTFPLREAPISGYNVQQGVFGSEVTVPYYHNARFIPTMYTHPHELATAGSFPVNYQLAGNERYDSLSWYPHIDAANLGTDNNNVRACIYYAAGPDLRLSKFRGFPHVILQAPQSAQKFYPHPYGNQGSEGVYGTIV